MKPGDMVKTMRRGHGPHGHPAILIAVRGDVAIIKPRGHGHAERVPLRDVRPWKSRNGG